MNDKKQLWLARDLKTKYVFLYECEPVADENGRFDFKGDNYEHLHCFDDSDLIPPGHKAPITIGEAVDCRKPEVPVMTVSRDDCSNYWVDFGNNVECAYGRSFPVEIPRLMKCRIAWDENGIRLIGTPERI